MINLLLNIPAADEPADVLTVFNEAGYYASIPESGIMPSSEQNGGKSIVHAAILGATYQQVLDITSAQRPVWQIFGAQDLRPSPNPGYDPEDEQSPPEITVVYEDVNTSVWQVLPDRILYDEDGNEIGTKQQTELHTWVGTTPWPSR